MKMASPKRSSLLSVPSIITQSNSDITTFIREFKQRIRNQLQLDNEGYPFLLFDEIKNSPVQRHDDVWLNDNQHRFFRNTPNERLVKKSYLSELGYIYSMTYSPDGNYIITGHSTGLIQVGTYPNSFATSFTMFLLSFIVIRHENNSWLL